MSWLWLGGEWGDCDFSQDRYSRGYLEVLSKLDQCTPSKSLFEFVWFLTIAAVLNPVVLRSILTKSKSLTRSFLSDYVMCYEMRLTNLHSSKSWSLSLYLPGWCTAASSFTRETSNISQTEVPVYPMIIMFLTYHRESKWHCFHVPLS